MKADVANLFWNKKVNLMAAIAKGQIKVQGSLPKALKLLPAIEPAYPMYQALLKEKGYDNMIVK
jgi:putative sterol carrier protein